MKRLLYFIITGMVGLACFSCGEDKETIVPSDINNLSFEERPGEIFLQWDMPKDSTIHYVKVNYYDPLTEKNNLRLSSCDTILIPDTRQKFGKYDFTVQPVSYTGTGGEIKTIQATSGRAPATYVVKSLNKEPIPLTGSMLSTNAQEPSEGPIENLLDGNSGTFFHTRWNSPLIDLPHYIDIRLNDPVKAFGFWYQTRDRENTCHPASIEVYVSEDGEEYELISTLSDLAKGSSVEYSSPVIFIGFEARSYLRLAITSTFDNSSFFTMSLLNLFEAEVDVYDPEAE